MITSICMPILTTYQSTAAPATPLSAVVAVAVFYDQAKAGDCPGAAPSLQCYGRYR